MSGFKESAVVFTNKATGVTPTIAGDLTVVSRNGHLQTFDGITENQLVYTFEVTSISGGLDTRLTTVENNYATKAAPVPGTYNTVIVNTQGIVTSGGNIVYTLPSDLNSYTLLTTTASISGDLQGQINAIIQEGTTIASSGGSILINQNGSAFNIEVAPIQNHNSLLNIQGGTTNQYYHLTEYEYSNISGAASGAGSVNTSIQLPWKYDNSTVSAYPGIGKFRLNNLTVASATALYLSKDTNSGIDAYNVLNNMDVGDKVYLQRSDDSTEAMLVTISSKTNNTTWFSFGITVDSAAASPTFTNNKVFSFVLINYTDLSAYTLLTTTAAISASLNTLISDEVTNRINADLLLTPLTTTASISGDLIILIGNEVTNRTNADLLLTPLTTTASISGGFDIRLTTVENNYATKSSPVPGTYNTVAVGIQGIVISGSNIGYALIGDLDDYTLLTTTETISGSFNIRISNLENPPITSVATSTILTSTQNVVIQTATPITTSFFATPIAGQWVNIKNDTTNDSNILDGNGYNIEEDTTFTIYAGEAFTFRFNGTAWKAF